MSTSDRQALTTTSYAILGLLTLRPWTTYELAQQMDRSLRNFWPRAQSRIYEEPKRLATLGYASASSERVGRRPRTVYRITAKGRRALKTWLRAPGAGPIVEFESLLKLFYAEHATIDDVHVQLDAIRAWADRRAEENIAFARLYRESGGPFPDRLGPIVLAGKFMTDFTDMVHAWVAWAEDAVRDWDDTGHRPHAAQVLEDVAARQPPTTTRETASNEHT